MSEAREVAATSSTALRDDAKSAALEVTDLSVDLGGRRIVREVTLRVAPGEVLGLLGPSGAGKSTLFRCLAGTLTPTRGSLRLGEVDLSRLPTWRRARLGLGIMPQEPSVLLDLSVHANLQVYAELAGSKEPVRERAASVGLSHRLDVKARALSAGERRRLELLRATTGKPSVLLCDEPFAGVDPKAARHVGELLRDLAAQGTAVVLADHHVDEALAICHRAVLLLDGRVAASGAPDVFRADPLVRGRYLGSLAPRDVTSRSPSHPAAD